MVGSPSPERVPFPGDARSGDLPTPVGRSFQGKKTQLRACPACGIPIPVGGLSQGDAGSGGMSIPKGSPSWSDAHPRTMPRPAEHPATTELHPSFATALSRAAIRPHAWMWGCRWGQWPSLSPLAPAPVTPVPSPALLFPRIQGEPSAPAGSGDGRCSFPVCRLVPPGAAPNSRPRRHQPHRPGEFQHRRCCSRGSMVMGAAAAGGDGRPGRERRQEWLGWRRAQREEEEGLRGGEGRRRKKDRQQPEGLMDVE